MSTAAADVSVSLRAPLASREIRAGSYVVHVGAGLRNEIPRLVSEAAPAHHFAVVSDDNVAPLYGDALHDALGRETMRRSSMHVVPAGEHHKTREQWARLTDELLAIGASRDTTIVALGGGVVGDLAGFVAATFLRGVPVVQCPTSLLAMIDASVGGKTGVDTAAGKNLVGAFHPPSLVVADVEMVQSLPVGHRRAGLAEAVKHGVIADAAYLARIAERIDVLLAAEPDALLDLVATSVAIKAEVVGADERESGRRKTLNFGHTIGHAVEHTSGYALSHGECVAIGMVAEARIAERMGFAAGGLASEIEEVLRRIGLPVAVPPSLSADVVLAATRGDKKARAGQVEYALPAAIGAMAGEAMGWGIPVPDDIVMEVLR